MYKFSLEHAYLLLPSKGQADTNRTWDWGPWFVHVAAEVRPSGLSFGVWLGPGIPFGTRHPVGGLPHVAVQIRIPRLSQYHSCCDMLGPGDLSNCCVIKFKWIKQKHEHWKVV